MNWQKIRDYVNIELDGDKLASLASGQMGLSGGSTPGISEIMKISVTPKAKSKLKNAGLIGLALAGAAVVAKKINWEAIRWQLR